MSKKQNKQNKNNLSFDFQKIFELSPEAIVILSRSGKFLQANNRIYDWLGYQPRELIGHSILKAPFLPLASKKTIALKFLDRIRGKKVNAYIVKFITKKNKEKYGKIIGVPIRDKQGKIIADLAMITDVTKEYVLELKLKEGKSERKKLTAEVARRTKEIYNQQLFLNNIINQSPLSTWILDRKGTLISLNKAGQKLFTIKSSKKVIGQYNIFKDSVFKKNKLLSKIRSVFKSGQVINFQVNYSSDLELESFFSIKQKTLEITIFPIRNTSRRITNVVIQHLDISSEKAKQDKLKKISTEMDLYFNMAGTMLVFVDLEGKVQKINRKGLNVLGYSEKQVLDKNWVNNFLPSKDRKMAKVLCKKVLSGQVDNDVHSESLILTKNGQERLISWYRSLIRNQEGKIIGCLSSGEDITRRRKFEKQAQRREYLLEMVSIIARELLVIKDWKEKINKILAILGERVDLSRVYIFQNIAYQNRDVVASQINEWTAPGISSEMNNPRLIRFFYRRFGFRRWLNAFSKNKNIRGHISDFPVLESKFLARQNIKSILAIPIFVADVWWGFIGFDECRYQRKWNKSEISVLDIVSDLIASSIQQENYAKELNKKIDKMQKMNKLMVGRELKMIELKKKIKALDNRKSKKESKSNKK